MPGWVGDRGGVTSRVRGRGVISSVQKKPLP